MWTRSPGQLATSLTLEFRPSIFHPIRSLGRGNLIPADHRLKSCAVVGNLSTKAAFSSRLYPYATSASHVGFIPYRQSDCHAARLEKSSFLNLCGERDVLLPHKRWGLHGDMLECPPVCDRGHLLGFTASSKDIFTLLHPQCREHQESP